MGFKMVDAAQKRTLEDTLTEDIAGALDVAVRGFMPLTKKGDITFYDVFCRNFTARISSSRTYKYLDSKRLNNELIPNLYAAIDRAEGLVLADDGLSESLRKLPMNNGADPKGKGLLYSLPNFPKAYKHEVSLRDVILGALIYNSAEHSFDLCGLGKIYDLFDILAFHTYIGKSKKVRIRHYDGRTLVMEDGCLRLENPTTAAQTQKGPK